MRNFILVVLAVMAFAGVSAADDKRFQEMLKWWRSRAETLKLARGELRVETTWHVVKNSRTINDMLSSEVTHSNTASFLLDFSTGRFRIDYTMHEFNLDNHEFEKRQCAEVFNGSEYKSANYPDSPGSTRVRPGGPVSADMAVVKGSLRDYPLNLPLTPILFDCGRFPRPGERSFYPGSFQTATLEASAERNRSRPVGFVLTDGACGGHCRV